MNLPERVVLATNNPKKLSELRRIVEAAGLSVEVLGLGDGRDEGVDGLALGAGRCSSSYGGLPPATAPVAAAMTSSRARFEARQRQAADHRASSIEQTIKRMHEGKSAAPLPVPSASNIRATKPASAP